MKIFYDSEFTGLHQQSSLISIALIAENGPQFYAEFADYKMDQCDDWINRHVIQNTLWLKRPSLYSDFFLKQDSENSDLTLVYGDSTFVKSGLIEWLQVFDSIEIWSDCYAYDWVLFCELFGGALNIPQQISYLPMDLATLFRLRGFDPDTDREKFAGYDAGENKKHNALYDAQLVQACHNKLIIKD